MRTYRLNFFANMFDNVVEQTADISWSELKDLFSIHTVTANKDFMMFNCCHFKTEDFEPAEKIIKNDGVTTRTLVRGDHGELKPRRASNNVVRYSCLVFDYDGNGNTLDVVKERFTGITHLGYTSYNHAIKGVDKCRVIIPLLTDIPVEEYKLRGKDILKFAETDDESTVSVARAFYLPSCPAEGKEHAEVWSEDGEMIDWNWFERREKKSDFGFSIPSLVDDSDLVNALFAIPNNGNIDYQTWLNIGMAIHSEMPDSEGLMLWTEWSGGDIACKSKWSTFSGANISAGTLFHYAKQNGWKRDSKASEANKQITAITELFKGE